jgi:phosphoribosylanthranilate isomerase
MLKPYEEYCDYYLFDTNGRNSYGGTGEQFDWKILNKNKINKPFFLSGGIGIADIEKVQAFEHPFFYAVDVNSRVEAAEGIKDMEAIKKLADGLFVK